jgi:hypothetical protein
VLAAGYTVVVFSVAVVVLGRAWNGHRLRKRTPDDAGHPERPAAGDTPARRGKRGKKLSSESRQSEDARKEWWKYQTEGAKDPNEVRSRALTLWRARCEQSREIAQDKEKVVLWAASVFVLALAASLALVVGSAYGGENESSAATRTSAQR